MSYDAASHDPDTFESQIDDAINAISDAIGKYLQDAASFVSDHATAIGFLAGGPLGAFAGHKLKEKFQHSCDSISDKWNSTVDDIRTVIGGIVGDPLKMASISDDYRDAARKLTKHADVVTADTTVLSDSWHGRGFNAYNSAADAQNSALKGLAGSLITAAELFDQSQSTMLNYWNDQLKNLFDAEASFLSSAGKLGDLGNAPTFEAGPALDLIASILTAATNFIHDLAGYLIDLTVTESGQWDGLTASLGANGLPNEQWPEVSGLARDALNSPFVPN